MSFLVLVLGAFGSVQWKKYDSGCLTAEFSPFPYPSDCETGRRYPVSGDAYGATT